MEEFTLTTLTLPDGRGYELSVDANNPDVYHQAVAGGGLADTNWRFTIGWIEPGDVFFDMGANIGTISIPVALKGASVHAFELLYSNVQHLLRSAVRNGIGNLSVVLGAVSDNHEAVGIGGTSAWGTVIRDSTLSIASIVPDDYVGSKDLPKIDLVKIDVEGSELAALRGARALIERYSPDIVIEGNAITSGNAGYSYRDILAFLEKNGYQLFRLHEDRLCPWDNADTQEVIFADYFATRRPVSEAVHRTGWKVAKMTDEEIIQSIEQQDLMGDLHKHYLVAVKDKLPPDIVANPRVSALIEKWSTLGGDNARDALLTGSA